MDQALSGNSEQEEPELSDDEIEARTVKYNVSRIAKLSSGKFALFTPFSNDEGIKVVHIGTLEELQHLIPTADECQDFVQALRDESAPLSNEDRVQGLAFLTLLGLTKPKEPFKRRI